MPSQIDQTIVSVQGVTRIPTSTSASVSVETPPVTLVSCALVDPCTCEFSVAWTNGATYDVINILENGVTVATLPGLASSASLNLGATTIGGPESATIAVVPRRNGVEATPVSCVADCPDVPDPIEPTGLLCSVDPFTGVATLSWANSQPYLAIELSIDGGLDGVLNGGSVTTTVNLLSPAIYTLCLDGTDLCGVPFASVCCTAIYEQVFDRGDANVDGSFNISDPIYTLNFLFGGGPMACVKAGDMSDSGDVNIADIVFGLQGIFGVGPLPNAPFGACGVDPTSDLLSCASFPICP